MILFSAVFKFSFFFLVANLNFSFSHIIFLLPLDCDISHRLPDALLDRVPHPEDGEVRDGGVLAAGVVGLAAGPLKG